ncbi:1-phosphofructokinase [Alkalicella caledoniensis]|uniref:Tagatose-6-phosphate kinase n=2 Tax=Alkalicella caledoniensis TaxID=2731377 RepID=A0A7G9WD80_ALKCA|nr:1-phosphofructokinase [Alkalicella caledoniensis]
MIITITLNPAVDKTIEVDDFMENGVNRVSTSRLDAGGKGINVSKVVQVLGEKTVAVGLLGGSTGDYIKNALDQWGIENSFTRICGDTRTNIKVVDKAKGFNTDINEKGPEVSENLINTLVNETIAAVNDKDILVLSGSVPGNIDKNIYGKMVSLAKEKGAITILDADGELLKEGIKAGPYMVKPNIHELERLYGTKINNEQEAIELAKDMFNYGVQYIVISLGEKGSIFISKESTVVAAGLKVDAISTVGAGDSMVAALAVSLKRGYTLDKRVRLAVATSAASVMTPGTQPGELEIIEELEKQVTYKKI